MTDYGVTFWQRMNEELLALDARYRDWEETQNKKGGKNMGVTDLKTNQVGEGAIMKIDVKADIPDSEPLFMPAPQGVNDINTSPITLKIARRRGRPEADGVHVETKRIVTAIYRETVARPDGDEVYLLQIKSEGISIPWPEGMTAKGAIIAWVEKIHPF